MKNDFELPQRYMRFHEVVFCSNVLIDVSVPILIESTPICLIGRGLLVPVVWLSAPIEPESRVWNYVVKEGHPLNPAIDVLTNLSLSMVDIKVSGQNVLRAKKLSDENAVVDLLDLRPLGLNVHGTAEGLYIGQTSLVRNNFTNVRVAFAMGK